ncbi:MAG: PRC-barrel domain-containing protein [Anaerolineae bacterium]
MPNHTIKSLLGQPVITVNSGRRVGSIQEILYDAAENRVTAIILSKPPVAGSAKAVTADHIRLFGVHVTLIDSDDAIRTLTIDPASRASVKAGTSVIRTQVITTEGRKLGEVSDIALDETGNILGYRMSHNLIRDAFRGKTFIPVSALFAVGDDAILVESQPEAAEEPAPVEEPEEPEEEVAAPEPLALLEPEAEPEPEPEPEPAPEPESEEAWVIPPLYEAELDLGEDDEEDEGKDQPSQDECWQS